MFKAEDKVRVRANPGYQGTITGKVKKNPAFNLYEVRFPDKAKYYPEDQLEEVQDELEPLELMKAGRFGKASDLRRNITFHRLNSRLENLFYSMQITNTDFYAYQYKPVLKFLNSPRNGILIADEVGLGKTIEAGLIWTELRSRFDCRRIMVLCPAVLREKWKIELYRRFGIDAELVNSKKALENLSKAEEEGEYASFAMIGSMQGLRPKKDWQNIDEESSLSASSRLNRYLEKRQDEIPLLDLLVIDEAHYLRNSETSTSKLGQHLKGISEHIVLMSATPIHLKSNDLFELLKLLDEDTFGRSEFFDDILKANKPLVQAREGLLFNKFSRSEINELLQEAKLNPMLANNRQLDSLIKAVSTQDLDDIKARSLFAHRLEKVNLLSNVISRTRKREVVEWKVVREAYPESVDLTEEEYKFYVNVTDKVREFCVKNDYPEGFLVVTPQRQISSSMPAALYAWQNKNNGGEDALNQEELYEDIGTLEENGLWGPLTTELIESAKELGDYETLRRNDSKYFRLRDILNELLKDNSQEKIVLFSYFRGTLSYLRERLDEDGVSNIVLMGGEQKQEVLEIFKSEDGPNILLSSEVGSEGIDLQFSRILINYDLPWNPMRVEQRIGRLDRLGQKSEKIFIWNLFADKTIEQRIYSRLYARLKVFEESLGGLEEILGEKMSQLSKELLSQHFTPEEEEQRIEQCAIALENKRREEETLEEDSATLMAYGDYVLNQVMDAKQNKRWIAGEDIWIYAKDFFNKNYPGCEFKQVQNDELVFSIKLSPQAKFDFEKYIDKKRLSKNTRLLRNDQRNRLYRFENKVGQNDNYREEIINQFHPVISFINNVSVNENKFYPTVAIRLRIDDVENLDQQLLPGYYVFMTHKWSVKGLQDKEIIKYVVCGIDDKALYKDDEAELIINFAGLKGKDWPEAKNQINLKYAYGSVEKCDEILTNDFGKYQQEVQDENNDRADIQLQNLDKHLQNRLATYENIRQTHIRKDRKSLVKATEGKKTALRERVEKKKWELESKRKVDISMESVSAGVLNLY